MSVAIGIDRRPGEFRIVATLDGKLVDIALWRPGSPDRWGDVVDGVVRARAERIGGVFVALGPGGDGFLPDREAEGRLAIGERVRVRVIRAAMGGKGLRLSGRLSDDERALPSNSDGAVRIGQNPLGEMLARYEGASVRVRDAGTLARLRAQFAGREVTIGPEPGPDATEAALALDETRVDLPGGASATIVPTPAMVAIDVDLGGDDAVGAERQTALFASNRAVLPALAEQIRLRNLAGAILIDLAGLSARKRQALEADAASAFMQDGAAKFLGFTRLGLAELVRTARRPPWHELRRGPLARALDAAEALVAAARARPGVPLGLAVAPALHAAIERDRILRSDVVEELGVPGFRCRAEPGLGPEAWSIEGVR